MAVQVADGCQDIQLEGRVIEVFFAGTVRGAEATEVDGQDFITGGGEDVRLRSPALLIELAAVGEEDSALATTVKVGGEEAAIFSRDGDGLLGFGEGSKK